MGVVVYVLCGGLHFVVLRWMCIGVSTKRPPCFEVGGSVCGVFCVGSCRCQRGSL